MCVFKEEERSVLNYFCDINERNYRVQNNCVNYWQHVLYVSEGSNHVKATWKKDFFLSFVYLFIYFVIRISRFFPLTFFVIRIFFHPHFSIRFSHPHPPSADIRSAFYKHPAKIYSALSFDRINFFNMANLLLLSRKAFVMCYCFRAPKKTFFFDACQSDCQIVRPALVSGTPNRKKPYNKHLISLVFSVRTVNYGSSFFPSIYGPRAFIAFSIALDSLQR